MHIHEALHARHFAAEARGIGGLRRRLADRHQTLASRIVIRSHLVGHQFKKERRQRCLARQQTELAQQQLGLRQRLAVVALRQLLLERRAHLLARLLLDRDLTPQRQPAHGGGLRLITGDLGSPAILFCRRQRRTARPPHQCGQQHPGPPPSGALFFHSDSLIISFRAFQHAPCPSDQRLVTTRAGARQPTLTPAAAPSSPPAAAERCSARRARTGTPRAGHPP